MHVNENKMYPTSEVTQSYCQTEVNNKAEEKDKVMHGKTIVLERRAANYNKVFNAYGENELFKGIYG